MDRVTLGLYIDAIQALSMLKIHAQVHVTEQIDDRAPGCSDRGDRLRYWSTVLRSVDKSLRSLGNV